MIAQWNREGANMGARKKLNSVAVTGCLALAAILGCLSNSWIVFIIVAMILLGMSLYQGDIRPGKRGW